jgi:UrcA family protein
MKRGALIALSVLAGGFAFAQEPMVGAANTITINYSDLDLTQPDGVKALYRRVATAARQVCKEPSPREITRYAEFEACFDDAVTRAVEKVDAPQLTAFHRARSSGRRAG